MLNSLIGVALATIYIILAMGFVGFENVDKHAWIEAPFWAFIVGGAAIDLVTPFVRQQLCPFLASRLHICQLEN